MSSLVDSIFGDVLSGGDKKKNKKTNEALTSLFDRPVAEVDKKQQQQQNEETKSKKKETKKKKAQDDDSSSSSSSDDDDSSTNSSDSNKQDETPANDAEKDATTDKPTTQPPTPEEQAKIQEEEELRTVFVGNLPLSTTRRSLAKVFKECGKVQSTRLRSVAVAGVKLPQEQAGNQDMVKKVCTNTKQLDVDAKASLQGYVVFAEQSSVEKALRLNNTPLQDQNPNATRAVRRIRVDYANPTLDPKRSVFVGNLPYQAEEASLQDHFVRGCGLDISNVEGVRVIRDKDTFQCKGFGYILFQDATMVATALQKMPETIYMKRPLRVKVCGKSLKGRRGGAPNSNNKRKAADNDGDGSSPSSSKKQRQSFEGKRATPVEEGAMKRVAQKKNKRVRGEKKKSKGHNQPGTKPGVSKRVATEAKVEKRVKKLQKRISKGMGKARK